jgi:hypothetical protein
MAFRLGPTSGSARAGGGDATPAAKRLTRGALSVASPLERRSTVGVGTGLTPAQTATGRAATERTYVRLSPAASQHAGSEMRSSSSSGGGGAGGGADGDEAADADGTALTREQDTHSFIIKCTPVTLLGDGSGRDGGLGAVSATGGGAGSSGSGAAGSSGGAARGKGSRAMRRKQARDEAAAETAVAAAEGPTADGDVSRCAEGHAWSTGYRDAFGPCLWCGVEPWPDWDILERDARPSHVVTIEEAMAGDVFERGVGDDVVDCEDDVGYDVGYDDGDDGDDGEGGEVDGW